MSQIVTLSGLLKQMICYILPSHNQSQYKKINEVVLTFEPVAVPCPRADYYAVQGGSADEIVFDHSNENYRAVLLNIMVFNGYVALSCRCAKWYDVAI